MKKDERVSPIRELRERIGRSQRELADALEVHHSYIANLENNLINIEEEDEEAKSKIREIFEKIAEWSGEDAEELIQKQNKATSESLEIIKAQVKKQIADVGLEFVGSNSLTEDEIGDFLSLLRVHCTGECKSPIAVIREVGGITQRHLAQAADVSQAYIARLERGELTLSGPNSGIRLLNFIIDSLGLTEDNPSYISLYDIIDIQDAFRLCNKERAKEQVKAAFDKLKREKTTDKNDYKS